MLLKAIFVLFGRGLTLHDGQIEVYLEANIALTSLSLMGSHSIWVLAASLRVSPYVQAKSIYTRSHRAGPSCSSECFEHGAHIPLSNAGW